MEGFLPNIFFQNIPSYLKGFFQDKTLLDLIDSLESVVFIKRPEILSPTEGVFLFEKDKIFIDKDCMIEPGSYIKGPCYIGKGVVIRGCAYIREGSFICDHVVVGHGSEVTRSLILEKTSLAHFNYVGDSIIGSGVNVGAGSICANLRLDKKEISFSFQKERVSTSKRKLGALIGDHSSIACNVVLNPGECVSPRSFVINTTKHTVACKGD